MSNRIGKYEIEIDLGRGAFTRVYRARDTGDGRRVALKVPAEESGVELFSFIQHEAALVAKLGHRNIVEIYDWGGHQGQPYLALEYLEGATMRDAIAGRPPFALAEKIDYLSQLAVVLQAALKAGSVHLDFKPSSLMLRPDGTLKCMDFGMVQLTEERARRLAQQGYLEGSIRYASPEQFTDTNEVDTLSDVFSYGVVYYEFLTGRHPFEAPSTREMISRICQGEAAPLRSLCPDCPERLERIVHRALQKDRRRRYVSLEELEAEAREARCEPRRQAAAPPSPQLLPAPALSPMATKPWSKQPAVWVATGILLTAGAAGWHWRSAASLQTPPVAASAPVMAPPPAATPLPAPTAPQPEPARAEAPKVAEPAAPLAAPPSAESLPIATPVPTPITVTTLPLPLPQETVRDDGDLKQPKLIRGGPPAAPPIAGTQGVSGTVQLQATVGKDGRVKGVKVLTGDPLLTAPAKEAVLRWLYEPGALNGEPIEVDVLVQVVFSPQ